MSAAPPAKCQKLSKDWNADLLHLFQSGDQYDCTFVVGLGLGSKVSKINLFSGSFRLITILQEFKCHSLILSAASPFFKKMLEGVNFQGHKMGRDEPILLKSIKPHEFESAMW
jgi:hypothetical protein